MKFLRHLVVLALLLALAGPAFSQLNPNTFRNGPKILELFREVVAKPSESTVRILVDGKEVALGTIVDADGWIITKWSEIKASPNKISVKLKDHKIHKAEVRGVKDDWNAAYDIAMLKVDAKGLPAIQWGKSSEATAGKWVASAGLLANPVGVGVVSVAARALKPGDQPPDVDAGFLGVGLAAGSGGAKITALIKDGPAGKARPPLKINDVIYEAGGRKTIDHEALIQTVGRLKVNEEVLLKVRRGEEEALHFVASRQAQEHALFLGLDTLHGHTQAQCPAKRDNRLNDHTGIGGMFERQDKAPVDLELVERQLLQIGQA